jgi:hypothetical protein
MMKKLLVLITMFLLSTLCKGYEFKGYEMGMSLSDFKDKGVHKDVFLASTSDRFTNWESKLICSDEIKSELHILHSYGDDTILPQLSQTFILNGSTITLMGFSVLPGRVSIKGSNNIRVSSAGCSAMVPIISDPFDCSMRISLSPGLIDP